MYLVTDGKHGDVFACTPSEIDSNNSSGAEFKLIKVDDKGRVYVEDNEPDCNELYMEDDYEE